MPTNPTLRRLPAQLARGAVMAAALAALAALAPPPGRETPRYDLVLANGRVIDPESGLDARRHIGLKGGTIAAISAAPLTGATVIDAAGLVVAPGFIDLHSHVESASSEGFKALDGVTTALELEMGVHPVDAWYDSRAGRARLNYGAAASHMAAHALAAPGAAPPPGVLSPARGMMTAEATRQAASRALDTAQTGEMARLLQQGLDAGALGVGIGVQYVPAARRAEILRAFEVAAKNRVPLFVHPRTTSAVEPDSVSALQELLANSAVTGASLHVVHVQSSGGAQTPILLEMIDGARRQGADVTTEAYPYGAGVGTIGSVLLGPGWQTRLGIGYGDIQDMTSGARFTAATFEATRAARPDTPVVAHFVPEALVAAAVAHPGVMIASDSVELGAGRGGHPRTAGTYARVLGHYVRDTRRLSLADAIAKMTLLPARRLEGHVPAMARKGRIRVGADADLTIFDPRRVAARATYADPMQASVGITHVLVNGEFVVRDGQLIETARPGRAVRRRVTAPRATDKR